MEESLTSLWNLEHMIHDIIPILENLNLLCGKRYNHSQLIDKLCCSSSFTTRSMRLYSLTPEATRLCHRIGQVLGPRLRFLCHCACPSAVPIQSLSVLLLEGMPEGTLAQSANSTRTSVAKQRSEKKQGYFVLL